MRNPIAVEALQLPDGALLSPEPTPDELHMWRANLALDIEAALRRQAAARLRRRLAFPRDDQVTQVSVVILAWIAALQVSSSIANCHDDGRTRPRLFPKNQYDRQQRPRAPARARMDGYHDRKNIDRDVAQ
ncbi:hypothetical protein FHT77_006073 [Rhizobium sp. BK181]|uniref:hypothetical protein n=1 Tax=Rhizobium sp. BK181 TaxID=2587072 RepID=UPI00161C1141|nr:hypothetical protein [Rhizobium sp. BK181]MBB3320154.1 hypothetical protein [Rhizobium sp. BK181]